MRNRNNPKKPERNPAHIAFPKTGPIRLVIEEISRDKVELEMAIGKKFADALAHFEGTVLRDLKPGPEPADLVCKTTAGCEINIQMVEVVNQQLREINEKRISYRHSLMEVLKSDLSAFNGCKVLLVAVDQTLLPSIRHKDGRDCLELLADHIRTVGKTIGTLAKGKIRVRRAAIAGTEIAVIVERIREPIKPEVVEFNWGGGYCPAPGNQWFCDTVRSKIGKNYAKPTNGKFILLAYSIDTLLHDGDADVENCRQMLETTSHPFDEVWFFYPYARQSLGATLQVWPRTGLA